MRFSTVPSRTVCTSRASRPPPPGLYLPRDTVGRPQDEGLSATVSRFSCLLQRDPADHKTFHMESRCQACSAPEIICVRLQPYSRRHVHGLGSISALQMHRVFRIVHPGRERLWRTIQRSDFDPPVADVVHSLVGNLGSGLRLPQNSRSGDGSSPRRSHICPVLDPCL